MVNGEDIELYKQLDALRREHRTIEHKIRAYSEQMPEDMFTVTRFKKEKLALRDKILSIEATLYPDIIA